MPGDRYGEALFQLMGELRAKYGLRTRELFIPALAINDAMAILAKLKPDVLSTLDDYRKQIRALEPPESLKADHERLLQFMDEEYEVVESLQTTPSMTDISALTGGPPDLDDPLCKAEREFSMDFRVVVSVFFGEAASMCAPPE